MCKQPRAKLRKASPIDRLVDREERRRNEDRPCWADRPIDRLTYSPLLHSIDLK